MPCLSLQCLQASELGRTVGYFSPLEASMVSSRTRENLQATKRNPGRGVVSHAWCWGFCWMSLVFGGSPNFGLKTIFCITGSILKVVNYMIPCVFKKIFFFTVFVLIYLPPYSLMQSFSHFSDHIICILLILLLPPHPITVPFYFSGFCSYSRILKIWKQEPQMKEKMQHLCFWFQFYPFTGLDPRERCLIFILLFKMGWNV